METTSVLAPVPQGPWYNPPIEPGVYDAAIRQVIQSSYGKDKGMYLQFIFWLPSAECHFVTNLYFPNAKRDNRSVYRLACLCRCVGRVPQDALDSPQLFQGEELRLAVTVMTGEGNGGRPYRDVDQFLFAAPISSQGHKTPEM